MDNFVWHDQIVKLQFDYELNWWSLFENTEIIINKFCESTDMQKYPMVATNSAMGPFKRQFWKSRTEWGSILGSYTEWWIIFSKSFISGGNMLKSFNT